MEKTHAHFVQVGVGVGMGVGELWVWVWVCRKASACESMYVTHYDTYDT